MPNISIDLDLIKSQAQSTIIRQAMVMKEGEWTPEEIALVGYKRLVQLKNYYDTHSVVSQKAKLDKLKQIIKDLGGDPEQAVKDLGGDPEEYLAKM